MLFNASLWLHIIGITLLAGTTVVDFILTRKFWAFYARDPQEGILARKMLDRLPILIGVGTGLILLSGVGMMAVFHTVFGAMLWFRIKIVLVVLVILNAVLFGRRQGARLNRLLMADAPQPADQQSLEQIRKNMNLFHLTQLTLLFIIFFLSAFKFN
ncbi:hypothetical protein HB364_15930 [Pseudoflavitalea sp. X16]|uniref:hypothetical protein n=1 Tax=Paraflavitalea devenefica TaxID=2716334 RepID=UPI00142478C3|nr:hypothetical protein [Paraflavitalea devenefica]NII26578.1 hypothetical protein [Paraflavitalea devenefica]